MLSIVNSVKSSIERISTLTQITVASCNRMIDSVAMVLNPEELSETIDIVHHRDNRILSTVSVLEYTVMKWLITFDMLYINAHPEYQYQFAHSNISIYDTSLKRIINKIISYNSEDYVQKLEYMSYRVYDKDWLDSISTLSIIDDDAQGRHILESLIGG